MEPADDIQLDDDTALELPTEPMRLNMGPSHPAMHGTIRMVLDLDGETVQNVDVQPGYLHRGFEKTAECRTYNQVVPLTDRLNYCSSMMNNIAFGEGVKKTPQIFSNNYFMRGPDGKFMTSKLAKKVWLHWAEGRIHGEYETYDTPTGKIPLYQDLKVLFKKFLGEDFSEADYTYLFTFRCTKWIEKLQRTKAFYTKMDANAPAEIHAYWDAAIAKIQAAKEKYGDLIKPGAFKGI